MIVKTDGSFAALSMSHKCRSRGWHYSEINYYELVSMERGWQLHNAEITSPEHTHRAGKYLRLRKIITTFNFDCQSFPEVTKIKINDKLLFLASVHGFNKTAVVLLQWSQWGSLQCRLLVNIWQGRRLEARDWLEEDKYHICATPPATFRLQPPAGK